MERKLNQKFKEFRKWWEEEIELYPNLKYLPHTTLSITYNPKQKSIIEKDNAYDDDNIISDKGKFVEILSLILIEYFGTNYFVRRYCDRIPWISESNQKNKDLKKISTYLYKHKVGLKENFYIKRLKPFLKYFVTYPTDFSVSPIILIPNSGNGIIMIHEINTIVIGSQDLNLMESLHKCLDFSEITVIKRTGVALI